MGHNISHALGTLSRIHYGIATGLVLEVSLPWLVARPESAINFALVSQPLGGPADAAALPETYAALMRAVGISPTLPEVCDGVSAVTLTAAMKSAANHGMSQNAACPISLADLDEIAGMMMALTWPVPPEDHARDRARTNRGSVRSLSPLSKRPKPKTARKIHNPGKTACSGAKNISVCASHNIRPRTARRPTTV